MLVKIIGNLLHKMHPVFASHIMLIAWIKIEIYLHVIIYRAFQKIYTVLQHNSSILGAVDN